MGIFTDLFQLVSVAFGMKNSAKQFQENLEMAERYNRWGKERGDPRDFQSAIGCLDKCYNEDAPKTDCMIRKYCSYSDAYLGCMELQIRIINDKVGQVNADRSSRDSELASLNAMYEKQLEHIKQLKAQGSMIQAAEEEARSRDTATQVKRVEELRTEDARPEKIAIMYASTIKEYLVLRSSLEMRLAEMNGTMLPKDEVERIINSAHDRMALLDHEAVEHTPEGIKPPAALLKE